MGVRMWVTVLAVPALLGVTGCGGGGGGGGVASAGGAAAEGASAAPSKSLSPEDAQLKFAQCMRQNGIDVPDPGAGQDTRTMRLDGKAADGAKLQAAMRKCQSYLQAGGKMPDLKDPKVLDQFTEFAQCMREHGVDMPDPGPDGFKIQMKGGVDKAKLNKAREACRSLIPQGGGR